MVERDSYSNSRGNSLMNGIQIGTRKRSRAVALSLLAMVAFLGTELPAHAAAPARVGQPYAESICNTDPNIIFCEDFNYPGNLIYSGVVDRNNSNWINPGLTTGLFGFIYGLQGRQINPASSYPSKPSGAMPSGTQPDYVWVANWDSTKGAVGNGSTWGKLREPGGNYANGSPPAKDIYIRMQYYVTPNYTWPGDPKIDKYGYGSSGQCYDNKIFYAFPPEGVDNPTNSAYSSGFTTECGVFDSLSVARFSDALVVRYGDTSDNYPWFPMCTVCTVKPQHNEYGPYQSLILRNPGDSPILGKIFRLNTDRWYTLEYRYKLSSVAGKNDGIVEVWVNGSKVYSASDLITCGNGLGDCTGIGAINIDAYHNGLDPTVWNGQQVIDNLIVSKAYIGPPGGTVASTPPTPPASLSVTP
ncbi:MAG TPA: hypothetical protein VIW21_05220 [Chthoniobacterales bacterium]